MAERDAERPSRALGGRFGMGAPAWDAANGFCSQLMFEGRLERPSDVVVSSLDSLRTTLRVGVRRRDEGRSTSRREPAGKK